MMVLGGLWRWSPSLWWSFFLSRSVRECADLNPLLVVPLEFFVFLLVAVLCSFCAVWDGRRSREARNVIARERAVIFPLTLMRVVRVVPTNSFGSAAGVSSTMLASALTSQQENSAEK